MRFLLIVAIALIGSFFILFGLRLKGLGEIQPRFDHPFLEAAKPWRIIDGGDSINHRAHTIEAFQAALKQAPDLIFYTTLTLNSENKLVNPADLKPEDLLMRFPKQKFIFDIHKPKQQSSRQIIEAIRNIKSENRILWQSDEDWVLMDIKLDFPRWLYGTGRADLTRLVTLGGIWLGPLAKINGDVIISPYLYRKRSLLDDNAIKELQRRGRKIIIGPLENKDAFSVCKNWHIDGYISSSLNLLLEELPLSTQK